MLGHRDRRAFCRERIRWFGDAAKDYERLLMSEDAPASMKAKARTRIAWLHCKRAEQAIAVSKKKREERLKTTKEERRAERRAQKEAEQAASMHAFSGM